MTGTLPSGGRPESRVPSPESRRIRIIGIDPGSLKTGVGVIEYSANGKLTHVFHATLAVGGDNFPQRLKRIFEGVCEIIDEQQPHEAAIERVFMARNADSALKLGQARGAAICALVTKGMDVHEFSATEVKRSIVGGGRADKHQVQHMIAVLLGIDTSVQADAADALAIAITHAHARAGAIRIGLPRKTWRRRR
ncbi:MAG: crossover junction endodeoxyribonuclease RuvC [Rhodanobacteraceae bacterium]